MTLTADRIAAVAAPPPETARDAAIDFARAACLVVVFVLHALMVGVSVGPDGPVLENALEGWAWFAPATWVVQVMPLFFVIGGYAGWTAWRRSRARGGSATDFVRGRIERLVRPAIALVAVVGTALAGLAAVGVPPEVVATAGYRIGQPLWFLAVYLGCSALVPLLVRAHERRPVATLAALAGAAAAVDAVRFATGVEAVGFANLAFVWLGVQQLGFHLADGRVGRMSRAALRRLAAGSLAVLLALTLAGPYSTDLFQNLNPPTLCLLVLGVAQLAVFALVRDRLRRIAELAPVSRVLAGFGRWGMTLYLWHLPAFVLVAGGLLVLHETAGLALPAPLAPEWWGSRGWWLAGAAAVTGLLVAAFARWERRGSGARGHRAFELIRFRVPVPVAVVAGVVGVGVALVIGFAPLPAVCSLLLLAVALRGSRYRGPSTSTPVIARASALGSA